MCSKRDRINDNNENNNKIIERRKCHVESERVNILSTTTFCVRLFVRPNHQQLIA